MQVFGELEVKKNLLEGGDSTRLWECWIITCALQRKNSLERGTQILGHSLDLLTQLERDKLRRAQENYFPCKTLTALSPAKMWEKYRLFIMLFLLSKLGLGILRQNLSKILKKFISLQILIF